MNKNIILLFAAAAILLLSGCAKEPGLVEAGSITIEASVGQMTKVQYGTDGKSTNFTAGDKIAVYGWTGVATAVPATRVVDGVVNTLGTDGKWTPESPMLWKPGLVEHYFLGVYPVHAIADFTADEYTLDPADYAASDLLIGTNLGGVKASQGPVLLTFDHAMAKLVVNLKFRSQWDAAPAVGNVTVSAKTKATVDYLTKTVSAKDDASEVGLSAESSAPDGYAITYSGLQVPQEGVRTVKVTIGTQKFVYEAAADIPLVSGQYTTMGLIVGKDKIELSGISVCDWTAGGNILEGEAQIANPPVNPPVPDNEPIVFADSGLKQYLVDNPKVNLNRDDEISKAEAAAVTSLQTMFGTGATEGRDYRQFNEFQYFAGITELTDGSFNKWMSLESIILPESITKIKGGRCGEAGIFQNCPKLKVLDGKFTHDNVIVYNKQLLRVAQNVVYDGQFIPDGVEIIGNKAVSQSSTSDLFLPSSVKTIRDYAFDYSAITTVRFAMTTDDPNTAKAYVDSIAETAFSHCFKLEKFIGPTKNGYLRVTPDKLGLVRDTTLYAYALGADATRFVIPEEMGVRCLAEGVFDIEGGTTSLKEIGLPSTLRYIRTGAFRSLANVSLYFRGVKPPKKIEDGAFENTSSHTITIYVPAVMDGSSIDVAATDARIEEFETAMKMGNNHFNFFFYIDWPFD